MTTFILVHGGSHGSWCWDTTVEPLRSHGHRVLAVDLPRHPGVTLEDWIATLSAAVDDAAEPPVLVAHSMGGLTASSVAERRPADVAGIVYVSAVVPVDGQDGLTTLGGGGEDSVLLEPGSLVPAADGSTVTVDPAAARRAFYQLSPEADVERALPRLCPEATAPMATPLSLGEGFASVPKVYIGATADQTVPPALQQRMAAACGASFVPVDSDHSPFLSAPDELVQLLLAAGDELTTR